MIRDKEKYLEMKADILNILLKQNYHICFLLGDNGCGKTEIANEAKKIDSSVQIFDNYCGKYNELPKEGKNIVITYNRMVMENASPYDMVIMFYDDLLYCVGDIEDSSTVQNMFYKLCDKTITNSFILQRLLCNSIAGVWSNYNQKYLDEYLKNGVSNMDRCILDTLYLYKEKGV